MAIVAQAVDASEADQALITRQFVTLLEVVWPGSASPIPPVAWYSPRPQQQGLPPTSPG
jgi:hypothetical protein